MFKVTIKKLKRVFLVGFILLGSQGALAQTCSYLFEDARIDYETQTRALNELIAIESRLERIQYIKNEIQVAIDSIRETIDQLLTEIERNPSVLSEIEKLSLRVSRLETQLTESIQRESVNDLKEAMTNLRMVKPNFFYKVDSMDPYVARIIFSENVVNEVFHSNNALYRERLGDQMLKSLYRGRKYAADVGGIFPFINDRSVFKIKVSGTAIGALRLAGYFIGHDFYVVSYIHESNHGRKSSDRIVEQVNNIRRANSHDFSPRKSNGKHRP